MSAVASPFHDGEQAVQSRVGVREKLASIGGKVIRDFMPDQHREFFAELPFMLLSAHDAAMHPRVTLLVGRPGFARSPDPHTLRIDALPGEPLRGILTTATSVGLLGIQLETRRRNRMNGTITDVDARGFTVHVGQSFGNCPQYIQARAPVFVRDPAAPGRSAPMLDSAVVSRAAASLIARADTFFIGTSARAVAAVSPNEGLDVSHRGGKPGFVRQDQQGQQTVLTWPEFRGNYFFNTLGNIAKNPRTGLLFVDFETGDCLSLGGEAEILWDDPRIADFAGAQRFVRFRVTSSLFLPDSIPLRWSAPEPARELPATGSWR